jgi:PAS domain S-box-containing protein
MNAIRNSKLSHQRNGRKDGIVLLDPIRQTIKDANPVVTTLLGYTRSELWGKKLCEVGFLEDKRAGEAFLELKEKGRIRYKDLPLKTKAGERLEVEFVSNVYEEGGAIVIQCKIRNSRGPQVGTRQLSRRA